MADQATKPKKTRPKKTREIKFINVTNTEASRDGPLGTLSALRQSSSVYTEYLGLTIEQEAQLKRALHFARGTGTRSAVWRQNIDFVDRTFAHFMCQDGGRGARGSRGCYGCFEAYGYSVGATTNTTTPTKESKQEEIGVGVWDYGSFSREKEAKKAQVVFYTLKVLYT